MPFEKYSYEFRYLFNLWEGYIIERVEECLLTLEEEYENLTVEERDTLPQYKETDFHNFCNSVGYEFHDVAFNTKSFFDTESCCLDMIKTPKEMLYILQYVETKNEEYGTESVNVNEMTLNMGRFIYYLSLDMIEYENPLFVEKVLAFIQKFEDKRNERKIAAAIICKRTDGFDGNILSNIISFMK